MSLSIFEIRTLKEGAFFYKVIRNHVTRYTVAAKAPKLETVVLLAAGPQGDIKLFTLKFFDSCFLKEEDAAAFAKLGLNDGLLEKVGPAISAAWAYIGADIENSITDMLQAGDKVDPGAIAVESCIDGERLLSMSIENGGPRTHKYDHLAPPKRKAANRKGTQRPAPKGRWGAYANMDFWLADYYLILAIEKFGYKEVLHFLARNLRLY